jgi:hypothetical protein
MAMGNGAPQGPVSKNGGWRRSQVDRGTLKRTQSPAPGPGGKAAPDNPLRHRRVVLDGHGTWAAVKLPSGGSDFVYTSVPEGTTITFHQKPGEKLPENLVKEIIEKGKIQSGYYYEGLLPTDDQSVRMFPWHRDLLGDDGGPHRLPAEAFTTWPKGVGWQGAIRPVTYGPHELVPNLTLCPVYDQYVAPPDAIIVKVKEPTLLSDLLKPGMGDVFWAACQAGHETDLVLPVFNDALPPMVRFHNNMPRPGGGLTPGQAQRGGGAGQTTHQYEQGKNYDPPL